MAAKVRIVTTIDQADADKIQKMADTAGISVAAVARMLIHMALKNGTCPLPEQSQRGEEGR